MTRCLAKLLVPFSDQQAIGAAGEVSIGNNQSGKMANPIQSIGGGGVSFQDLRQQSFFAMGGGMRNTSSIRRLHKGRCGLAYGLEVSQFYLRVVYK